MAVISTLLEMGEYVRRGANESEPETEHICRRRGGSRYDVSKIFGFFTPSPCPHLDLNLQPPLQSMLYRDPNSPHSDADIISGSSLVVGREAPKKGRERVQKDP